MDKKKVTRRAAVGAAVGAIAASPFIIHALKGRYEVNTPDGALARTVGGKTVMTYEGKEITIEVPRMELRTPEDREKLKATIMEQLEKNPQFVEVNKMKLKESKGASIKRAMDRMDEEEKRQLEQLAKLPGGEEEKRAAAKQIEEQVQACRDQILETLDKTWNPPVQ